MDAPGAHVRKEHPEKQDPSASFISLIDDHVITSKKSSRSQFVP